MIGLGFECFDYFSLLLVGLFGFGLFCFKIVVFCYFDFVSVLGVWCPFMMGGLAWFDLPWVDSVFVILLIWVCYFG